MRFSRLFVAAACLLLTASQGYAQLTLSIQINPNPSPYLSDWRSQPNTVRFIISNPTQNSFDVRIEGYIEGDSRGRVAETKPDAAIPPTTVPPGTTVLNGAETQLLSEGAIRYIGAARTEAQLSGRLPEDRYRLCAHLAGYAAPHAAISPQTCASFDISLVQPAVLISPQDKSEIKAPPAFQWSAVHLGAGRFSRYELTLIELSPGQTSIASAFESNIPIMQRETSLPVYQHLPHDPALEDGKHYAWRIRAFDPDGRATFANSGRSVIHQFTYAKAVATGGKKGKQSAEYGSKGPSTKGANQTMQEAAAKIITNRFISGNLYYVFAPGSLFPEHSIEQQPTSKPSPGSRKPLGSIAIRIVKKYKIVPVLSAQPAEVTDSKTGKKYPLLPSVVATGATDPNGAFSLSFTDPEKTVIVANATLKHTGGQGGEFSQSWPNATLYTYFQVEVVSPYYCSSGEEIRIDPGAKGTDVVLSCLVRTYNLDVTVKDVTKNTLLGSRVNVYIARLMKSFQPAASPHDEGELPVGGGSQSVPNPFYPTHKYHSSAWGYVIGAKGTEDGPNIGHVVFTRLVRNVHGAMDVYVLSALTPDVKPDTNGNDLFYKEQQQLGPILHSDLSGSDLAAPGGNTVQGAAINMQEDSYSGEVVYNVLYKIPTFTYEIQLDPLMPRVRGFVVRSDTQAPLDGASVTLEYTGPAKTTVETMFGPVDVQEWKWPAFFNALSQPPLGQFEIPNIQPSSEYPYHIRISKWGYNDFVAEFPISGMGVQKNFGPISLVPRMHLSRQVIDEQAKGLPGVEAVVGEGARVVTNDQGNFVSYAIPGWQPLHLEKHPKYADKDTLVEITESQISETLGALLLPPIVMFERKRRLELHVVSMDGHSIPGARVYLLDKYVPPSGPPPYPASPWVKTTNDKGRVMFAYDSPLTTATIRVEFPGQDYVRIDKREVYFVSDKGGWSYKPVIAYLGGRVKGMVYIGERLKMSSGSSIANQPAAGARVFIEGWQGIEAYTDTSGAFDLRGVPQGMQKIRAVKGATNVSDQTVGDEKIFLLEAGQTFNVNLFLKRYAGMDITKLYGFPVEVEHLTELPGKGGRISIDGAIIDVPANTLFKLKEPGTRLRFTGLQLQAGTGGTPPPAVPVAGSITLLEAIPVLAHTAFSAEIRTPVVRPYRNDVTQGRITDGVAVSMASLNINAGELDPGSGTWWLGARDSKALGAPDTNISALTSGTASPLPPGSVLTVCTSGGGNLRVKFYTYDATIDARSSELRTDGYHLMTSARARIAGCGSNMTDVCDVPLAIGDITIGKSGMAPVDPSHIPAQDITLMRWTIHAAKFSLPGGYFAFDGSIASPIVPNTNDPKAMLNVPFTALEIRPTELNGGTFASKSLDLLGIATMTLTHALELHKNAKAWFLSTEQPEIPVDQGGGKYLEGLEHSQKIVLQNFHFLSDASTSISALSGSPVPITVYDVASVKLNTFQVGYDSKPYLTMQGGCTLLGIPDLAEQSIRMFYTGGGTFGMDGIFIPGTPSEPPYIAGGVKLTIANGMLGPDGFIAEGTWGLYQNRVYLDNTFSLNTAFVHKKVGNGFSTIAEIINADHVKPPKYPQYVPDNPHQNLFTNPTGQNVKDVYGRTQIEGGVWTTRFVGWYQTPELAAQDTMRYTVEGGGGNGTVAVAQSTMLMKGTTGGISALQTNDGGFPKGPPDAPPIPAKSPFSEMTITPDFANQSIYMKLTFGAEISTGVYFDGTLTSVISFGQNKFWGMYAAGTGTIQSPPCQGSAIFVAGLNYDVLPEQQQQIFDYSESKEPLPDTFKHLTGFFSQVTISMPIPNTPNFDLPLGPLAGVGVHCTMGGEARLGLNFADGFGFFIGFYCRATISGYAYATLTIPPIPAAVYVSGDILVYAGAGGWFQYTSDAGASFQVKGVIVGTVEGSGGINVAGIEYNTGKINFITVGGTINGTLGAGSNLDISPTFSLLGF